MDFEENSVQRRLLNDFSPVNMKVFSELLNHLEAKNFRSFKNTLHYYKKQSIVDLDYVNPDSLTYLDIASKCGLTEFVELLLDEGAKPNRVNETHNRAPIHFATEGGHVDSLAALLAEPTINPNLEAGQQTALHIAVRRKDLTCAGLLLEKNASASIPNSKGLTALHLAAMKGQRDMVELILKKSRQCPDIDTYKDYNGQTTREVIQQKLPSLSPSLPPKNENREVNAHDLKYYLIANDETNFLKSMELVKIEVLHSVAEELLEMTAQRGFYKVAIGILEKLKGKHVSIEKAAQAAVQQSDHVILRELLKVEPSVANDLILSTCMELGMPGKRDVDDMPDRLECLKLILEQSNVDVRCSDGKYMNIINNKANVLALFLNNK